MFFRIINDSMIYIYIYITFLHSYLTFQNPADESHSGEYRCADAADNQIFNNVSVVVVMTNQQTTLQTTQPEGEWYYYHHYKFFAQPTCITKLSQSIY